MKTDTSKVHIILKQTVHGTILYIALVARPLSLSSTIKIVVRMPIKYRIFN